MHETNSHFPNLFLIGAAKCGTTSLRHYLAAHEHIFVPKLQEIQFFATDNPFRKVKSMRHYMRLYRGASQQHTWRLDTSTVYLPSRTAGATILSFSPNAHFLVILRDPLSCLPSWHSELLASGFEDVKDFRDAWALVEERRAGRRIPRNCLDPSALFYDTLCRHGSMLIHWMNVVGRERIHIAYLDDFQVDARSAMNALLGRIGLSMQQYDDSVFSDVQNRRKAWKSEALRALFTSKEVVALKRRMRLTKATGIVKRFCFADTPLQRISPELIAEIRACYSADVRLTEMLDGRRLSHWLQ